MSAVEARNFWKALVDNASSLIADAQVLHGTQSYGRARSLTVLAQEELGKALWIYGTFESAWSAGNDSPRVVTALQEHGRSHTKKYLETIVFGNELALFWGDYSAMESDAGKEEPWDAAWSRRQEQAEAAAVEANRSKQRGFYVGRDGNGVVLSPTHVEAGTIAEDLQTAAQVIEMLLIRDHSRMKLNAVTPYDSTQEQQFRLLAISHPQEWAAAFDDAENGRPLSQPDSNQEKERDA